MSRSLRSDAARPVLLRTARRLSNWPTTPLATSPRRGPRTRNQPTNCAWPRNATDEDAMINVTWTLIDTFTPGTGPITSPWLMARDDLGAATAYLRLKAKGEWVAMSGLAKCGPDGLVGQSFPD